MCVCFFFFKQKTAYEMRISDWSSDVCSSDLVELGTGQFYRAAAGQRQGLPIPCLAGGARTSGTTGFRNRVPGIAAVCHATGGVAPLARLSDSAHHRVAGDRRGRWKLAFVGHHHRPARPAARPGPGLSGTWSRPETDRNSDETGKSV